MEFFFNITLISEEHTFGNVILGNKKSKYFLLPTLITIILHSHLVIHSKDLYWIAIAHCTCVEYLWFII